MLKCLASLALIGLSAPCRGQAPFCEQLRSWTQDPSVAGAHWGVQVTTLTGTSLCGINEAQLFRPASNNKIFTTAAAMALLGAGMTFETLVTGKLDPATGVVTGDLTLIGGGDGNLDSGDLPYVAPGDRPKTAAAPFAFHDLDDLATQLAAKGVKAVRGDVVGDDSYFPYEPYAESWNAGDLTWGYGAPVSALTIVDNQLRLTVAPGKGAGQLASVSLDQHGIDYYSPVEAEVRTGAAKAPSGVQVERRAGSRGVRVYGEIGQDAPVDTEQIAIDDSAAYAAEAFRATLLAHGISVGGRSRSKHRLVQDGTNYLAAVRAPLDRESGVVAGSIRESSCVLSPNEPVLARHRSAAVGQDVVLTNKISQNLHAELLLHQLGRRGPCGSGSTTEGARMVRAFLLGAGLLPDDFLFYDGSGLSDHDLVAPRAVAKFLAFAATQPWFAAWRGSLPVGGVDGGLLSRFGTPATRGKVFAKTGTLGESRALSGYVTGASGRIVVFSILVDTHLPGTNADRTMIDRMVEAIASQN